MKNIFFFSLGMIIGLYIGFKFLPRVEFYYNLYKDNEYKKGRN